MKFGFHLSIAGGLPRAVEQARALGLQCLQIFAGNPRGWRQRPLPSPEAAAFRRAVERAGLELVVVHAPYLLNLASPNPALWKKSIKGLSGQLRRARLIEARAVVVHPGSRGDRSVSWGIERVAQAVERSLDVRGLGNVECWLENTAGGGSLLGGPISHLARLQRRLNKAPVGACLDTAHCWGAGYRLNTTADARGYVDKVRKTVGLGHIKLWHFNDTIQALGSGKDQHCHLGKGLIGMNGFRSLICNPYLSSAPVIMETPKDSRWADRRNLALVRRLEAECCKLAQ
ncbi:MAG: deoxyribonuclease IV [Desulfarculaceae bacterium]|jgi:deoxyribonuclease-4